jgi:CRISPR/Cas system CSM-associated protein Csm3 (group 7 of RAMP superfamily)
MPKDESFWNPYRLVPARETVERLKPLTDEKFQGINGRITCTIKNLTPLFIGGQSSGAYHPPAMRREKRIIPGSSLKGMFRSIAELAGGGCFVVSSSIVPHEMRSCSRVQELCIACRMFGAMERKTNARVHKGNVRISDAILLDERPKVKSMEQDTNHFTEPQALKSLMEEAVNSIFINRNAKKLCSRSPLAAKTMLGR